MNKTVLILITSFSCGVLEIFVDEMIEQGFLLLVCVDENGTMLSERSPSVLGEVKIFFQQLLHDNLHTVFHRNDSNKETIWKLSESHANNLSPPSIVSSTNYAPSNGKN